MGKPSDYWNEAKLRFHSAWQLRGIKKGYGNYVFGKITISHSKKLSIGNECRINHNVYMNAANGICLGDDVTLSAGVSLVSTGLDYIAWANGQRSHIRGGAISIGSHVWIGANATILPGVQITGKYVVIAANAVITHDVMEDYVIVAGVPGKIIKSYCSSLIPN